MLEFADLQRDAKKFPEKLAKAYAKQSSFGGLFCTCLSPIIDTNLFNHAQLIKKVAEGVDFYVEASPETKKLVLIGIYVYLWHQYDTPLQWFLNRPLLNLLQVHLDLDSLVNLDRTIYENSLDELSNFSGWVFANREYSELKTLYEAFPPEMQGNIYTQRYTECSDGCSWGSTLSSLMTQIGIKSLL